MDRHEFVAVLAAGPVFIRPAAAEVSSIKLGKQYGLALLAQMVMEARKLIEKQAGRRRSIST